MFLIMGQKLGLNAYASYSTIITVNLEFSARFVFLFTKDVQS